MHFMTTGIVGAVAHTVPPFVTPKTRQLDVPPTPASTTTLRFAATLLLILLL